MRSLMVVAAACLVLCSCDQPQSSAQLPGYDTPVPGAYEVSQLQYPLGASTAPTPQPTIFRQCVSAVDAQHPEALIGGPQLDACPERHGLVSATGSSDISEPTIALPADAETIDIQRVAP